MLILLFTSNTKKKNSHVELAMVAVDRERSHCRMVGMPREKERIIMIWK